MHDKDARVLRSPAATSQSPATLRDIGNLRMPRVLRAGLTVITYMDEGTWTLGNFGNLRLRPSIPKP